MISSRRVEGLGVGGTHEGGQKQGEQQRPEANRVGHGRNAQAMGIWVHRRRVDRGCGIWRLIFNWRRAFRGTQRGVHSRWSN